MSRSVVRRPSLVLGKKVSRWIIAFLVLWAGCRRGEEDAAPLQVAFAGCAEVRDGPECLLEQPLDLWVATPIGRISVEPPPERIVEVAGGQRIRIDAAAARRNGRVQVTARGEGPTRLFSLRIAKTSRPCPTAAAASAAGYKAYRAADITSADQALAEAVAAWARCGRRHKVLKDQLMRVHLRLSPTSTAASILGADRFDTALALLSSAEAQTYFSSDLTAGISFYRGVIEAQTANLRGAVRHLKAASVDAGRLGLSQERVAHEVLVPLLAQLGDVANLTARLSQLNVAARSLEGCERGRVLTNIGWALLAEEWLARPFGVRSAPLSLSQEPSLACRGVVCPTPVPSGLDIKAILEEAERLKRECERGPANARVNLALLAWLRGDDAGLGRWLTSARQAQPVPDIAPWLYELEARYALRSGKVDAARSALHQMVSAGLSPDAQVRALNLEGAIWRAAGRFKRAEHAWRKADRAVDQAVRWVGLEAGRGSFAARMLAPARSLVELLVEQGRIEAAFAVARHARARTLSGLRRADKIAHLPPSIRESWRAGVARIRALSSAIAAVEQKQRTVPGRQARGLQARLSVLRAERDEQVDAAFRKIDILPLHATSELAVDPGELVLMAFPGERAWFGFAVTSSVTLGRRLDAVPSARPEAMADWLLTPFGQELDRARRIRVLPFGLLGRVDVHALPWRGRPLGFAKPIVYALDIPPTGGTSSGPALVLGDSLGDLSEARVEAQAAARRLNTTAWLGEAASRQRMLVDLPKAAWLHFAGHAEAGDAALGSALILAGRDRWVAGEILTLPSVPAGIVLSACGSGKLPRQELGAGLAQAFVVAGAEAVVATSRRVADRTARRLTEKLYETVAAGALRPNRLPEALRQAQQVLAAEKEDWSAYRVWVP